MKPLPNGRRIWLLRNMIAQLSRLIPDPHRRGKITSLLNEEIVEAGGKPEGPR